MSDAIRDRVVAFLLPSRCACTRTIGGGILYAENGREVPRCWRHSALDRLETFALFVGDGGRYDEGQLEFRPWRWHAPLDVAHDGTRCPPTCRHRATHAGAASE